MTKIGKPLRIIEVEPEPATVPEPVKEPVKVPEREPAKTGAIFTREMIRRVTGA